MIKKGKKNNAGRKDKLTPEVQKKIINALELGAYIKTACDFAGISRETFYNWLKKGELETDSKYADFLAQVNKTLAKAELHSLQKIKESEQWQAHAWILERRFNSRWGKREALEVTDENTVGSAIKWDEEVTELISELTRRLAERPNIDIETEPERASDITFEREMETS